jgi:protein-S-isoprenylcysteine O-methyltransferase Ste14
VYGATHCEDEVGAVTQLNSPTGAPKAGTGTWIVVSILVALLVLVVVVLLKAIPPSQFPRISLHGWIAMGIGTFFSLFIGCGLMWLSFYSSRHGFDDRADPGRLSTRMDATKQKSGHESGL